LLSIKNPGAPDGAPILESVMFKVMFRSRLYDFVQYGTGTRAHYFMVESDGVRYWVPITACDIQRQAV
jgi:hypothetical protein